MPVCVGLCAHVHGTGDILSRKRSAQNVDTATMGSPSAVLTSHSLGRMILATLLVWAFSLTGCLGESPPRERAARALDIAGRLGAMTYDSSVTEGEPIVSVQYDVDMRSELTGGHRNGQSEIDRRLIKIERLLENLAMVNQHLGVDTKTLDHKPYLSSQSSKKAAQPPVPLNEVSEQYILKKLTEMYNLHQVGYTPNVEIPYESVEPAGSELPFQVVARIDLILSAEERVQRIRRKQFRRTPAVDSYKRGTDSFAFDLGEHDQEDFNDMERVSDKQRDPMVAMQLLDTSKRNGDATSVRVAAEATTRGDSNTALPTLYAMSERFARQNTLHDQGPSGSVHFHIDGADARDTSQHSYPDSSGSDDVADISPVAGDRGLGFHDPTSLKSLIHGTVQKMEDRLKKRRWLRDYDGGDLVSDSQTGTSFYARDDTGPRSSPSATSDQYLNGFDDDDETDDVLHKMSYRKDQDVPAAVLKAVLTGSVPTDREFWQNLSSYLDSKPYLSRSRRNADDYMNQFRRKMRARLSITYGHVMPCEYQDRYYCMNGGTCVFVGALKLKTCR
ncbi:unnamed protein product [Lymnaea stagnalis]|uniref:Uncharacterized protein n=1 Tax=Lymnaea stagnalis TaxID=6523 RepID=A0AAV2IBF7_LYMST